MVIVVIGFILLVIAIRLFIAFNPVTSIISSIRRSNQREIDRSTPIEMLRPVLPQPTPHHSNIYPSILHANAPPIEMTHVTSNIGHSHNDPYYIVGSGLVWEDGCSCIPE